MTTTATVSISRTALALTALVIADDGAEPYSLTATGLGRPEITPRNTYAPDSRYINGSELVAVTREQSALPLEVLVQADSAVTLHNAIAALDDAIWQFTYTVTITVGGVAQVWTCSPGVLNTVSGTVDHGHADQHMAVVALALPCHPIPGA